MYLRLILAIVCILPFGVTADGGRRSQLDTLLSSPSRYGFSSHAWPTGTQAQILALQARVEGLSNCQFACSLLSIFAPGAVTASSSPSYQPLVYWSAQQAELTPTCRIDVASATDISTTIKVSKLARCPFAVKSGGHAAFAGGSSIQDGILVNLAKLNQVVLSPDQKTASVGPGLTWYDVYTKLDPLNVSVVGGREAGVGVGGLTLGGGISYFSGRYGWACDNVNNYEVVLADGSIVNASPTRYSDLYWALRGGSGTNFGIVSRFDLAAFPQGLLWGGSRYYSILTNASLAETYSRFIIAAPQDDYAHLYIAFAYAAALGGFFGITGPVYGKAVADAPIFSELESIPSILDATGFMNMTDLAVALNQTTFSRYPYLENFLKHQQANVSLLDRFKTVTFKNDPALIKQIIGYFIEEATSVLHIPGIAPAFAFQPLSLNIIAKMKKNGGNVLGLSGADGPLTIMNLNWGWSSASDDAEVFSAINRFVSRSRALGKSLKLNNDFIYMNYASLDQDVFSGYGAASKARLEGIKTKYDPQNVFGKLQPGYFKL
ncbi:hypothetical protein BP5796_06305 [Coleophoma crateriformis]|uniref:FAD-binding PCMH-type domain-containing protein n=1 Tax=Coleophoma crateriformis TaxID=565419 RepID=A0A3D8RWN4_9HELO|nr:hypothetical protein BP5796_06305 [Coleophoma crateriformis]